MTYDDALRCASRSAACAARLPLLPPGTCCGARIVVEQATWQRHRTKPQSIPAFFRNARHRFATGGPHARICCGTPREIAPTACATFYGSAICLAIA